MIGQTISHYRILGKLGSGGMGEVYLAEDERLGRKVALKILPEQFTLATDRVRRFEQEARAASALNHPNIITIHDIGQVLTEAGALYFIATEFVEGETLRSRLNAMTPERKIGMAEAIEIAIQCCSALQTAHRAGIVHRDIKPENIMLRPDGYVKILDFGLAKLTEQPTGEDGGGGGYADPAFWTKSLFQTQPGIVMGTVAYMSPEQARGQRIDGRTDIFSLGVTLYEIVSGRRPFSGPTISDTLAELLLTEPIRLSQQLPEVPFELESVVTKMLSKDRDARYQSAQEVLNDLKRARARFEFAGDISANAPMDHSVCYETNIAMITEFKTPERISADLKVPSQAPVNFETNILPPDPWMPDSGMQDSGMPNSGMQDSGMQDSGMQDSGQLNPWSPDPGPSDPGPAPDVISSQAPDNLETNIIPITAEQNRPITTEPDWRSAPRALYSAAPMEMESQAQPRKSGLRRVLLPALVLIAILLSAGAGLMYFNNRANRDAKIDSVAVLPFTVIDKPGANSADYLGEGIAETVINTLSQWPELSVSSRNSVMRYKSSEVDARAIGRELEVKAVLLGKIRRVGKDLTINAELVDTSSGRQIWGENFNLKTSDLLAIQNRITRNITEKLQLQLGDAPAITAISGAFAGIGTSDSEAYDLYLKGRYFWNQGTREAMAKADEYFEKAAAKDPAYALAVAGCAACHVAGSDGKKPRESMEKARAVATAALKTDQSLSDAHLTLAQVKFRYDWDFEQAEREFKRAIQLNPKHAPAHHSYAEFLALMGRHREALDELDKARRLDPRSLPINTSFGTLAYYSRDYQEAVRRLKNTLEIDDAFPPVHARLGLAYEQQGATQDAVLSFLRAKSLLPANQEKAASLRKAFSDQGRDAFWREYLAQLTRESRERYIPQTAIAAVQVRLGKTDQALDTLAKAVDEKDAGLVELKVEPVFEPLRANSKFNDLLRRVGLAQ